MNWRPWKTIRELRTDNASLRSANTVLAEDNRALRKQVALFDHDGDGAIGGGSKKRGKADPKPKAARSRLTPSIDQDGSDRHD